MDILQNKNKSSLNGIFDHPNFNGRAVWLLYMGILVIYIVVRIVVWQNTTHVEDHDSIGYLMQAKMLRTLDIARLMNVSPDFTPFYPFFSAFFSLFVGSVDVGARLCSLLFSIGLFFALIGIGKRVTSYSAISIALLLITFNAVLMKLSISVLTEPSYTAVVYLGFWLFCSQYHNPTIKTGFLLGLLFSLCFLNRTEGIIFLAAIPLFQVVHFLFFRKERYTKNKLIGWAFFFIFGFSLLSLPQIMHVSYKMGSFAINGRQSWIKILDAQDGKSYEEKICGLDYSPKEINLRYLQKHPDKFESSSSFSFMRFAKKMAHNFTELYQKRLSLFFGPFDLVLFGFGLLYLLKKGHCYELFLSLAFIGILIVPPLCHNVVMRHISMIGPIIMLIEGIGIVFLSQLILETNNLGLRFPLLQKGLPFLIMMIVILCVAIPISEALKTPSRNRTYAYDPQEFKKLISIIMKDKTISVRGMPKVVSRKGYFPYMANVRSIVMPFTDYDGLVRYCNLNEVDYLFLSYRYVRNHPFLESFKNNAAFKFQLLYSNAANDKERIELYRFK